MYRLVCARCDPALRSSPHFGRLELAGGHSLNLAHSSSGFHLRGLVCSGHSNEAQSCLSFQSASLTPVGSILPSRQRPLGLISILLGLTSTQSCLSFPIDSTWIHDLDSNPIDSTWIHDLHLHSTQSDHRPSAQAILTPSAHHHHHRSRRFGLTRPRAFPLPRGLRTLGQCLTALRLVRGTRARFPDSVRDHVRGPGVANLSLGGFGRLAIIVVS